MKTNTGSIAVGGKGTVKCDKHRPKGLRNKRKAYWQAIRMKAIRKEMRLRKLERYRRDDE